MGLVRPRVDREKDRSPAFSELKFELSDRVPFRRRRRLDNGSRGGIQIAAVNVSQPANPARDRPTDNELNGRFGVP